MSTNKSTEREDKTVECLVCGKLFPRGLVDLQRHQAAVTLRHHFSTKRTAAFTFHCEKCNIFFGTEGHLELHKLESSCNETKDSQRIGAAQLGADIAAASEMSPTVSRDDITNKSLSEAGNAAAASSSTENVGSAATEEEVPNKILECMVCGKLFPRGAVDLARHSQAPTLQHMVSTKKSKTFVVPCEREKCSLWFLSKEHMELHMNYSSCNELVEMAQNKAAAAARAEQLYLDAQGRGRGKLSKGQAISAGKARLAMMKLGKEQGSVGDDVDLIDNLDGKRDLTRQDRSGSGDFSPRSKRARVLLPDDRKAFFGVASLMVDVAKVPVGVKLNTENFEAYIPSEKLAVLQKLKEQLLYDC